MERKFKDTDHDTAATRHNNSLSSSSSSPHWGHKEGDRGGAPSPGMLVDGKRRTVGPFRGGFRWLGGVTLVGALAPCSAGYPPAGRRWF